MTKDKAVIKSIKLAIKSSFVNSRSTKPINDSLDRTIKSTKPIKSSVISVALESERILVSFVSVSKLFHSFDAWLIKTLFTQISL